MKKLSLIFISSIVILSSGCAHPSDNAIKNTKTENAQIANPFVDCKNMSKAENLAGFNMNVPDKISGYQKDLIQAIKGKMVQVFFSSSDKEILIRKGTGSDDISGIYEEFDTIENTLYNEKQLILKSNSQKVYLATWTESAYAYSIWCSGGISRDTMLELVDKVL